MTMSDALTGVRARGRGGRARGRRRVAGFTLLEVMVALAILAIALVGLIGRTARNVRIAHEMAMLDVATDLVRSKMYDIEADLLKDGFPELDDELDGDFDDEGWPDIEWEATVEKVELPGLSALGAMDEDGNPVGGDGDDGRSDTGLPGGLPGGVDGNFDASSAVGMLGPYYETLKEVLEVSIRKVTVTVKYHVGQEPMELMVACYFTDPYGMYKVLPRGF